MCQRSAQAKRANAWAAQGSLALDNTRPPPCDNLAGEMGTVGGLASQPQFLAVAIMLRAMLDAELLPVCCYPLDWCEWCWCAKGQAYDRKHTTSAQ